MQKNSTFREVSRLISKFQNNISLRHLVNTQHLGLVENYLSALYQFSVAVLRSRIGSKKFILKEFVLTLN